MFTLGTWLGTHSTALVKYSLINIYYINFIMKRKFLTKSYETMFYMRLEIRVEQYKKV